MDGQPVHNESTEITRTHSRSFLNTTCWKWQECNHNVTVVNTSVLTLFNFSLSVITVWLNSPLSLRRRKVFPKFPSSCCAFLTASRRRCLDRTAPLVLEEVERVDESVQWFTLLQRLTQIHNNKDFRIYVQRWDFKFQDWSTETTLNTWGRDSDVVCEHDRHLISNGKK